MTDRGTISILGGSGFVGSELCAQLCSQGYTIKLFTRNAVNCRHLRVLPSLTVVQISDYSADNIAAHLAGSSALINLVGILNEKGNNGSGFHHAHVEVTRAALVACEKSVVRRFLQMSALNADGQHVAKDMITTSGSIDIQQGSQFSAEQVEIIGPTEVQSGATFEIDNQGCQ